MVNLSTSFKEWYPNTENFSKTMCLENCFEHIEPVTTSKKCGTNFLERMDTCEAAVARELAQITISESTGPTARS